MVFPPMRLAVYGVPLRAQFTPKRVRATGGTDGLSSAAVMTTEGTERTCRAVWVNPKHYHADRNKPDNPRTPVKF